MKIAIDIGGTFIKSGVIDDNNKLLSYHKVKTPLNVRFEILNEIIKIVKKYKSEFNLDNPLVGISTAGVVDSNIGVITYAGPTIPGYNGTNFKEGLKDLAAEINVNNDVSCALLGELTCLEEEVKSIFLLTIGTGIGGAYYEEKLLEGINFKACEIGYLLYDKVTDTTYENRASTTALKALIDEQYNENIPVEYLFSIAYDGDEQAMHLLNKWAEHVAEGIAQVQIIFDPEVIMIGGGISKQGDRLIQLIEPYMNQFLPENYGHAKIKTTSKGNDSALYGAVSKF